MDDYSGALSHKLFVAKTIWAVGHLSLGEEMDETHRHILESRRRDLPERLVAGG